MNIHPIFVHFPIAFLTIYAIAELIRYKKVLALSWWKNTKAVLLLVGTAGTFLALGTGDFGEKEFATARAIIHVHETVAQITTFIFCALSLSYIVSLTQVRWGERIAQTSYGGLWKGVAGVFGAIFKNPVIVILALVGLVAVTITGSLGGAIVYGPDADPVVHFVYSLFF